MNDNELEIELFSNHSLLLYTILLMFCNIISSLNHVFYFSLKVEDGEIIEGGSEAGTDVEEKEVALDTEDAVITNGSQGERKSSNWSQGAGSQQPSKMVYLIPFSNFCHV